MRKISVKTLIESDDACQHRQSDSADTKGQQHSLRRRYPTQPAQYLIKEWDDKLLDPLEKYNLGIDIYYKSATPDNVRKVHALGQEYNVWTVNEAVDGDALVAMGVDYITTNILEGTNKAE